MQEMIEPDDENPESFQAVFQQERGLVSNAPWWLISLGVHVVLLLIATLVYMERYFQVDTGEVVVNLQPKEPPKIAELQRPPGDLDRKGLPSQDNSAPSEDTRIVFPGARESDKNRSNENEEYDEMKGELKEFESNLKGGQRGFGHQISSIPGINAVIGIGPGAGGRGRYGDRFGSHEDTVGRSGGSKGTESAVIAALKWLARHQNADGYWNAETFQDACVSAKCSGPGGRDYDAGVTGLAILAFLGAGYTHMSKEDFPDPAQPGRLLKFGEVVKKGLLWMTRVQDPVGCIGDRGPKYMYNHAICALALSEGYGMTGTTLLKVPAQRAIDFVVQAQNAGKGWRYWQGCGDNDSSVTGWCVMALKSAELSELTFPKKCFEGALAWYKEVTLPNGYYAVGYCSREPGKVVESGINEQYADHPAMAAVALMSRIFMQKNRREPALGAVQLLVSDLPEWKPNKIDFYYWYYASLALFQFDAPEGPMWKRWNEPMKNALVPNQRTGKDGCLNGSWDPEVERWGHSGGRVYTTAIGALTLEVYYRYANVFGAGLRR